MEHSKRYLLQFALQKDPIEAKRYVTACFGKSMYSDRQQAEMEKKLCVGNHKNCHLLFTRGISSEKKQTVPDEIDNKRERREILAFKKETAMQYDKNKEHFEKNMAVYQNSIRRLTESLRMHLETADETFMDASNTWPYKAFESMEGPVSWTIRVFLSEKMRWRRWAFLSTY